ncbi:uncharacterized protein LOC114530783 [Dendronephthya gigantea]|uniref:uncharacterized protein LOC114530783 n=1 Tax=Dendronephthya gigantea TaxID=151771 RepID=UPI00106A29B5|nr:uncharacterized protein LOC114530783 [Dendronephthya gigantea]
MALCSWQEDNELKSSLLSFVEQGLKRTEIISFVERNFPQYTWSIRTLDRRLRHFDIYYQDKYVTVETLRNAVAEELDGPGKLLGYRALHKIRQDCHLRVPRDLVHAAMYDIDPEGLDNRAPGFKKKKQKGHFTTKGPNWVHSLDGHDKLMGYQNSTFPLAVYGCIDTATRKLLWLRIWVTNSDPKFIGRWYLEYLYESPLISSFMRLDKGTETGVMATMHAFLRRNHGDEDACDTVLYGPSTSNQIERWWKELHERLEKYFKVHLLVLKNDGHYNPENDTHRMLLAILMIPLMQKQLDIFKDTIWNTHRIQKQKDAELPAGIPNHMYGFPQEYEMEECGWVVSEEQLQEVGNESGVLDINDDFLEPEFRQACERVIPQPEDVAPKDIQNAFLFLKQNITMPE